MQAETDRLVDDDLPGATASDAAQAATGRRVTAWGLTASDLLVLGLAGLMCVGANTSGFIIFWTPRAALLLVALGPALVTLAWLVALRDRAAVALAAFLAWAAISTATAPSPVSALLGDFGTDRTLLLVAAYCGTWALGRRLSERGQRVLPWVLLSGLALSVLVGALQATGAIRGPLAGYVEGRASGLTDSPIYLGPLAAAAAVLAVALTPALRRWYLMAPVVGYFVMAVNLSGTRVALGALVAGGALAARRLTRQQLMAVVAAAVIGFGVGSMLPTTGSVSQRVSADVSGEGVSGITPRLDAWKAAATALQDRPLTGYGPGQFLHATTPHLSLEFARSEGPERVFIDAHNVIVEIATTTGLIGLILFGWVVVSMARGARGPLAMFGLVVAFTWLLEPIAIYTAPLVLLALGAADVRLTEFRTARPVVRLTAVSAVSAALGTAAACALVIGDRAAFDFTDTGDVRHLTVAERWLPDYPELSDLRALGLSFEAQRTDDPATGEAAIRAATTTLDREDRRWDYWARLGEMQLQFDSPTAALGSFRTALDLYPWSERAWRGVAFSGIFGDDDDTFSEANEQLCLLGSPLCEPADEP